ncbi:MAG: DNA repair protein RecN [Clostridia bacterium]|nr:DNA repair protein RecN [Clostridia bacterium]
MLKFLHIENIAVIEKTDIEFDKGFNVLTGETGAGKSIIIDSINAVLGERTSKDLIRAGCDTAEVSALFGELSPSCIEALKEYDVFPDEEGNILITRKLSLSGKGIIKINGKPFTASILRDAADKLINIHGQHDNQALLNPDRHIDFIDAVAENQELLSKYYAEFKRLNQIRRELKEIETQEQEKAQQIDLLKYQIEELEAADIKIGELESLKKKLKIAEDYEATLKALNIALNVISGGDDADGAISLLETAEKQLLSLKNDTFDAVLQKLAESVSLVKDVNLELSGFLNDDELLEINSDEINIRLDCLHKLMLKYGNSEAEMLSFLEKAKIQLNDINLSEQRAQELSEELDLSKERLVALAQKLTENRKSAACSFEQKVCEVLKYLNMPDVVFKVQIVQGRYTKIGCDVVEFLISANKGENLKPLAKIASGGELSRTMLAIKSSLLDKDNTETMIFDEIDAGISGFAADKVGIQLRRVSENRQVICVTHLAQIAAMASNHLLIEKNIDGGRTYTRVLPLEYNGRISEIARIMSGTELTENFYNSAKELLDRSNDYENL